jgi:hypothetical protein
VTPSDRELPVPRSAGTASVFRSPPTTPSHELISQSRTQDEVFTSPEPKFDPVEIMVHLPDSADHEQHARGKFNEILEDLIESEKNYVKSLGNVQVYGLCRRVTIVEQMVVNHLKPPIQWRKKIIYKILASYILSEIAWLLGSLYSVSLISISVSSVLCFLLFPI